ncbi:hypothetical protein [Escherichia coli]|uniref:hypothetical protein n=1 Tax=Escherichia coli TaxID=562 RepID=UPI001F1053F0|nr:hypothetical protein [Escherichia coli]MCH4785782.1 hypothetical protein [Escherichia coli]MCH6330338.1 hypothetical protein [Escherichia coli]MCH6439634.1 hypothetical protein [Escherichia coli]
MSGSAFAVTHHAFSSGAGRTSDGNGSHASTLKSPSYTKSVSWQHYPMLGLGGSNHEDVLLIQDYLKSPDLLGKLDKQLGLKAHYQSHKVDYFSRLSDNVSREEFIKYYRQHLSLHLDELSGVLTIELQAFDPAYGQRVVGLMLKESEGFINKLGHQVALEQLGKVRTSS